MPRNRSGSHYNLSGGSGTPAQLEWLPVTRTVDATDNDPNGYATSMTEISTGRWRFTIAAALANQTISGSVGTGVSRPAAVDIPMLTLLPTFSAFGSASPSESNMLYVRLSNVVLPLVGLNYRLQFGAGIHYNIGLNDKSPAGSITVGPIGVAQYSVTLTVANGVSATALMSTSVPIYGVSITTFQASQQPLTAYCTNVWGWGANGVTGLNQCIGALAGSTGQPIDPSVWFMRIYMQKASGGVAVAGGEILEADIDFAWAPTPDMEP